MAQIAGPAAMTATESVVVAHGQSQGQDKEPENEGDTDDDKAMKCEQLVHNAPGVEEIRRTPALAIESREMRVERTAESYRWVVYRSRGSSPEGWRTQHGLNSLHFNPPLQYLLPDKKPKFLAYAASTPDNPEDSEQMMTIVDDFGQRVGDFEWQGKRYTYSISKTLPCFPGPEDETH